MDDFFQISIIKASINIAINCGDPTSNISAQNQAILSGTNPSISDFGASISLICQFGYQFVNYNMMIANSSCTASGSWTYSPNCIGYSLVKFFLLIK